MIFMPFRLLARLTSSGARAIWLLELFLRKAISEHLTGLNNHL
jgi:hypothetical protein